jgi:dolichol-phosphate mannosyltransferase
LNFIVALFIFILLLVQVVATAILLSRLIKGAVRQPAIAPREPTPDDLGRVSIVIPTLNEVDRLSPCLEGVTRQSYELREAIVVDSRSRDGTPELVQAAAHRDPRLRLITDDPLPAGWVGRPWALHTGFLNSSPESEWILGLDADTRPHPQLVASALQAALRGGYDLISLSPQFLLEYPGEMVLQPALLMTLVYRFGPTNTDAGSPERVMANGQCFLCRRAVLERVGGYTRARDSFCDDVTLARAIARAGFKVGFLDGANVLQVRMYEGALETWREWGRSLDLKDACSKAQLWGDLGFLVAVQGLPLPIVVAGAIALAIRGVEGSLSSSAIALLGLNGLLLAIRFALSAAISPSYDLRRSSPLTALLFWFSPLADPLAVIRIFLSSLHRPKRWRGREYGEF